MTLGERIEKLRKASDGLQAMLKDADDNIGLGTWMGALGDYLDDIAEHAPSYERKAKESRTRSHRIVIGVTIDADGALHVGPMRVE